uniref:Uncharacterized protein n=1 Tax=Araneus ventricosus TaxID=182803 RepID=A0A4Y2PPS1_ARAVE|nr:hypothetical protein AVEN_43904-1 [Araneus ventricosus]GBN52939.1 hypothetical protein AVEN_56868-1 [Araneus ventricosus]
MFIGLFTLVFDGAPLPNGAKGCVLLNVILITPVAETAQLMSLHPINAPLAFCGLNEIRFLIKLLFLPIYLTLSTCEAMRMPHEAYE